MAPEAPQGPPNCVENCAEVGLAMQRKQEEVEGGFTGWHDGVAAFVGSGPSAGFSAEELSVSGC